MPAPLPITLEEPARVPSEPGAAIALGNFDGVHIGHQAVIAAARTQAHRRGARLGVAVFEPHPRELFQPEGAPFRLQSPPQRFRALKAAGADTVFEIRFDKALASLDPAAFSREVLVRRIGASAVAVGADFRYGRGRAGSVETLRTEGADLGFEVIVTDEVDDGDHPGEKVSSSSIRDALQAGDPALAARLLGRPWAVEGVVEHGAARGRTIGFPTANVALGRYVRPDFGVYAVRVTLEDGARIGGVANIGVKPTVAADAAPTVETHLFDVNMDLYGRTIEVELIAFLRPERRFESFDALKAQIAADADAARAVIAGL
jgi:riboflavin kinase/FMN adenylyltransferase